MKHKTIKIEELRTLVNALLLHSADDQEEQRSGMVTVLQQVLSDTGNYKGFGYLTPRDMLSSDQGKTPGINHYEITNPDDRFTNCLTYRRIYY